MSRHDLDGYLAERAWSDHILDQLAEEAGGSRYAHHRTAKAETAEEASGTTLHANLTIWREAERGDSHAPDREMVLDGVLSWDVHDGVPTHVTSGCLVRSDYAECARVCLKGIGMIDLAYDEDLPEDEDALNGVE